LYVIYKNTTNKQLIRKRGKGRMRKSRIKTRNFKRKSMKKEVFL